MGFWTAEKQRYALNYLRQAGLSNYGAAGLVSRWANVESTAAGPTAVNPHSGAFGIAQWLGARLAPIRGNTNFDAQLAYAVRELNGSERKAGTVLRNARNAQQGAVGASMYERAEGYNPATGVDNFTSYTAARIPGVLALLSSLSPSAPASQPITNALPDSSNDTGGNELGAAALMPLLLLAAGIGLYLWLR